MSSVSTNATPLRGTPKRRVLLADDHALLRAGIRALLGEIEGVDVIAEASNGLDALRLIGELQPDIVLLDFTMPDMSSLELLDESRRRFPAVRIIILDVYSGGEHAMRALRSGAAGYLPKSVAANELELAIKAVSLDLTYISGEVSRSAMMEFSKNWQPHPITSLTPRQREILTLVAKGLSTKAIGRHLNISVKTVESHQVQLMDRLDIHDVAGLVRYAIEMGLDKVE